MSLTTGKLADPEWRYQRAKRAGESRTSVDYFVGKIAERAELLTDEQVERLRALLPPVTGDGHAA